MTNAFGIPEGWPSLSRLSANERTTPQKPMPLEGKELFEEWVSPTRLSDGGYIDGHHIATQKELIEELCDRAFPNVDVRDVAWLFPAMTIILNGAFRVGGKSGYNDLVRRVPLTSEMNLILLAIMKEIPCIEWYTFLTDFWIKDEYQEAFQQAWEGLEVIDYRKKENSND